MDNLQIWNFLKQPPPDALKQIRGGRLKGMTDVNPQWRYQAMTELFGPCGIGWKYSVDKVWREDGPDNQVFAFAQVSLYINKKFDNGNKAWSDPIPGVGGSMLVSKEKSGLHLSDEGYKMAITDALSVAMKMVGVAADIYAGRWDGSKYKEPLGKVKTITEDQAIELEAMAKEARGGVKGLMGFLAGHNPPINSIEEIPVQLYDNIMEAVKARLPE